MNDWKPGDVAMVPGYSLPVLYIDGPEPDHWRCANGNVRSHCPARPLVVIDPEDREQVERLVRLLYPNGEAWVVNDFQTALLEFAEPTVWRPKEPTGLGAVVEDDEPRTYVRISGIETGTAWVASNTGGMFRWDEIAAVRVLHHGTMP